MAGPELDSPWLRSFHPTSASAPVLVALPYAGGSASYFFALSKALHPWMELQAVQYPGRQDRFLEDFAGSVGELADGLAPHVARLQRSGRNVAVFGHSLGAIVGFELIRRLESQHDSGVVGFVVSARPAPSRLHPTAVHLLDDDALVEEVRKSGGAGADVLDNEDMRALILPMLRADFRLAETYLYRPGPALSCPILSICGDADPTMRPEELSYWASHTTGPVTQVTLPGGHFYFDDDCSALVARIRAFVA